MSYVMELNAVDGIKLIKKAYEGRTNDLLMQRWMMHYEKEMSFDEFRHRLSSEKKTDIEILEDVKDILDGGWEI